MTGASRALLWAWVALTSRAAALPQTADAKFVDECVRQHNKARASVRPPASDMLYMTWDEGLANIARAWASGCDYGHNENRQIHPVFSSVGENIWAGSPPSYFSVSRAVGSWANETEDYNYEGNRCREGKPCGHYTQIVWSSTYKVGCAAQLCPDGINRFLPSRAGVFFVCNYAPQGNIGRRLPYDARGPACSRCTGACQDNQCRSPERDGQTRYDLDSDASGSGWANYVAILLTRPLALLFTGITAYAVRYKFPDVFCYE